jgi:N-acetylmuramoyl-L-alanine amidase
MKKNIKLFLLIILLSTVKIFAQPLDGVKLCIDPGHGGHDPANDRYIPETGFWESDGNWDKALHIREILENLGATVILTRQGNSDSDDHSLSQRSAIANNNNVDFFHSIHSNGFNGQVNYTLMLYKEVNGSPEHPLAQAMGEIMKVTLYNANRTTAHYNRGDYSFLGFNLGVLRNTNMPATLSEGSFHDYIPESWRLKNTDYRRHEAWAITRAFLNYFNAGTVEFGAVAGLLRDPLNNVSYFYLPSTNDQKKPINHSTVTLQPGNMVYNGDDDNNGFYLFDSLAPGQYTLYFEAEDFALDSAVVNVTANNTVFADKYLDEAPNYNAPLVVSHSPDSSNGDVSLKPQIIIEFDIRMNTALTQGAFSIMPNVSGSFTWENNYKRMIFTPSSNLTPGTEYEVKISTAAKTHFDSALEEEYSFVFNTKSKLNMITNYPQDGQEDISTSVLLILKFDGPIMGNSLSGNIEFKDSAGTIVPVYVDQNGYSSGQIRFEPQNALKKGERYSVVLKSGISDTEGLSLNEQVEIEFRTENDFYNSGTILETFEAATGWWDPQTSGSTVGTIPQLTTFTLSTERKINGVRSGKLNYAFSGNNGGVVRVFNPAKPNIGSSAGAEFGMWVYGDLSYNILEYWFYYNATTNAIVYVDTVNWTGWKLKKISIGEINGSGDRLFHSIVLRQYSGGNTSGTMYFDDVQHDIVTPVEDDNNQVPAEFALGQNYPNPFNPSTVINFSVPQAAFVSLKVYNVLGKEVAVLLNENMDAGNHQVNLDTQKFNLPSGVYIYKITAGGFTSSKKMMLLK